MLISSVTALRTNLLGRITIGSKAQLLISIPKGWALSLFIDVGIFLRLCRREALQRPLIYLEVVISLEIHPTLPHVNGGLNNLKVFPFVFPLMLDMRFFVVG